MIALDTNVISELMRREPDVRVVSWVDQQASATLFLTSLTLAEIRFGIAALPAGRRRTTLSTTFEDEIRPLFADRVLDFDEAASREYAALQANARKKGLAIGDADALIAATVRAHRFFIATPDEAPFEAAGVRVINPFAAAE
ncbi:type II toxin-antitoxin system VapC family toxin [Branchiibius sp. NY16-3462-2]|uniref:type II toxin-antitoxin system VapC family toxin n=1 Tax=Branchiibius sp. NY16-3462-2 TaxID=1807500 RepID=UPI00079A72BA|nr:type II toxin-antitoxin system VapC family toxin [Branchiibius sp. NY16-3462-2]KYH45214.1 plasmid stability protein StbB [Branchiibius sp. NY16-3462-2]